MVKYLMLVIGLCILSLVAVFLLSPSPEEKLERTLSRLAPSEALTRLNQIYAAGDRTPSLLLRRTDLLLADGNFDEARRTLEDLTASPDNSVLASEALARIELELGNVTSAIPHLEKAYALEPTPERLDRLARLLDLARNTGAELKLLAGADPATLEDRSARRLLELLLARADMAAAGRLLRVRAETAGAAREDMRGALIELLVGSDGADAAAELAAAWFSRDSDSDALAMATERLIERGHLKHAEVLARSAVASGLPGAHAVIPVFAVAGHGVLARSLLRDWLATHPRLTPEEEQALLEYAKKMNDFTAAQALLRRGRVEQFEPGFILGVLKGSFNRFGVAALPEFHRYMTPAVLGGDPLFAAEVSLAQHKPADAAQYLELAAARDLQPWESDAWLGLARQISAGPLRDRLLRARFEHTPAPAP